MLQYNGNELYDKVTKLKRKHDTYLAYQIPRLSSSVFSLTIFSLHRYYHLHHCGITSRFHMNPAILSILFMILVENGQKSIYILDHGYHASP